MKGDLLLTNNVILIGNTAVCDHVNKIQNIGFPHVHRNCIFDGKWKRQHKNAHETGSVAYTEIHGAINLQIQENIITHKIITPCKDIHINIVYMCYLYDSSNEERYNNKCSFNNCNSNSTHTYKDVVKVVCILID